MYILYTIFPDISPPTPNIVSGINAVKEKRKTKNFFLLISLLMLILNNDFIFFNFENIIFIT